MSEEEGNDSTCRVRETQAMFFPAKAALFRRGNIMLPCNVVEATSSCHYMLPAASRKANCKAKEQLRLDLESSPFSFSSGHLQLSCRCSSFYVCSCSCMCELLRIIVLIGLELMMKKSSSLVSACSFFWRHTDAWFWSKSWISHFAPPVVCLRSFRNRMKRERESSLSLGGHNSLACKDHQLLQKREGSAIPAPSSASATHNHNM